MNVLDSLVSWVSPQAGVRRVQARLALGELRGYEAAKPSRRSDWRAGSGSANAEIAPSLVRLRNRCRDMVRNNEYAARAIDALVADTVGTGVTAKATDQEVWRAWQDECDFEGQLDFNGLMELLQRGRRESGEGLIRLHRLDPHRHRRTVPLRLQVLEADHLDETKNGPTNTGNMVIAGVEFTPWGQRVAYWLWPIHPGEIPVYRRTSYQSVRIPATEVLHYYRKRRAAQVRGVPEMAVSIMRQRDLADYEQAELMRKKIESCYAVFVRTDGTSLTAGAAEAQRGDRPTELVSPGMIKYVSGADEVSFGAPSAAGGYGDYTATQLHAIAVGAGVTYETLTGDLSRVNYSSLRAGQLVYRRLISQEQWLALVPMVLNPLSRQMQAAAFLAGLQRAAPAPFTWTMPKFESVDPLKDALAGKERARALITTVSELIREGGDDPDEVFAERAAESKKWKDLGILSDADAAVASKLLPPEAVADLLAS